MYQQTNPLPEQIEVCFGTSIFYYYRFIVAAIGAVFFLFFCTSSARSAGTICAGCKLQISQQVTFERQAFNATMAITNGLSTSLTNLQVQIYFTDASGNSISSTTNANATGNTFFYEVANGQGIPSSINGGQTATLGWLIIPSAGASGNNPNGTQYYVGATVTYTSGGQQQSVKVVPDYIYVQPQPQLTLDYFLPSQVYGTDPTSSVTTPPLPFNLGVRVKNTGYGTATSLVINSGQPKIVNNPQGLAVQFILLGAAVNDAPVSPTLLANFGPVGAQQASVARWVMTSSLSGTFSFSATFTHADSLGGAVTSLLTATNSYSLVHDVLVDLAGRDAVRDFLALDGSVLNVYESQGTNASVSDVSASASLASAGSAYQFHVPAIPGFLYAKVSDPFNGQQGVQSAVRADGKQINLNNVWFSKTFNTATNQWNYYFNLFDANNTSGLAYTIVFGTNPLPPVFGPLTDQILVAGQAFSLQVTATDPDGTTPVITSGPLPKGATLSASSGGKATLAWTPTVGQEGSFPVSFIATEGSLSITKTLTLTVGTGTKLQNWKQKYFPGITDPNMIGDTANPSGDGFSNLLKYALNIDPTKQSANSGILIGTTQANGHTYLTLTYVVRTDDPNLTYTVVGSNSPTGTGSPWTAQTQSITVSQNGVPANMQRFEVQDSQPIDTDAPRRFLKLQVTNTGGN